MNMNVEAETEAGKEQKQKKNVSICKIDWCVLFQACFVLFKAELFFWQGGVQQGYWDSH